ncbi:Hypothetical protein A7982_01181 [Minicystis rosea]|nr:Hypothetical protein A7982_01181 [Minicystis rosea]
MEQSKERLARDLVQAKAKVHRVESTAWKVVRNTSVVAALLLGVGVVAMSVRAARHRRRQRFWRSVRSAW